MTSIEKHLALFCLATYGEGDPTDNAQEFYEWLREDGRELNNLHYAVRSTIIADREICFLVCRSSAWETKPTNTTMPWANTSTSV